MESISKLSDRCKNCSHVDDCDNKRMVACAIANMPPRIDQEITVPAGALAARPILRDTSLKAEIEEKIKEDLFKKLRCAQNKSLHK